MSPRGRSAGGRDWRLRRSQVSRAVRRSRAALGSIGRPQRLALSLVLAHIARRRRRNLLRLVARRHPGISPDCVHDEGEDSQYQSHACEEDDHLHGEMFVHDACRSAPGDQSRRPGVLLRSLPPQGLPRPAAARERIAREGIVPGRDARELASDTQTVRGWLGARS